MFSDFINGPIERQHISFSCLKFLHDAYFRAFCDRDQISHVLFRSDERHFNMMDLVKTNFGVFFLNEITLPQL